MSIKNSITVSWRHHILTSLLGYLNLSDELSKMCIEVINNEWSVLRHLTLYVTASSLHVYNILANFQCSHLQEAVLTPRQTPYKYQARRLIKHYMMLEHVPVLLSFIDHACIHDYSLVSTNYKRCSSIKQQLNSMIPFVRGSR